MVADHLSSHILAKKKSQKKTTVDIVAVGVLLFIISNIKSYSSYIHIRFILRMSCLSAITDYDQYYET